MEAKCKYSIEKVEKFEYDDNGDVIGHYVLKENGEWEEIEDGSSSN